MFGKKTNPVLESMGPLEKQQSSQINGNHNHSTQQSNSEHNETAKDALIEGNLWFDNGEYKKALELFSTALITCVQSDVETFLSIYERKTATQFCMGDYSAVVEDCSFILKLTPDNLPILTRRMQSYEKIGRVMDCINGETAFLSAVLGHCVIVLVMLGYTYLHRSLTLSLTQTRKRSATSPWLRPRTATVL